MQLQEVTKQMFASLHMISEEQVRIATKTLKGGDPVLFRVDPDDVYALFQPKGSQQVAVVCVRDTNKGYLTVDLTPSEYSVLDIWSRDALKRISVAWGDFNE